MAKAPRIESEADFRKALQDKGFEIKTKTKDHKSDQSAVDILIYTTEQKSAQSNEKAVEHADSNPAITSSGVTIDNARARSNSSVKGTNEPTENSAEIESKKDLTLDQMKKNGETTPNQKFDISASTEAGNSKKAANETTKINLGDGLHLLMIDDHSGYYQFQMSLFSKSPTTQLGLHPKMTLEQARAEADIYLAKVKRARKKEKNDNFDKRIIKLQKEKGNEAGALPIFLSIIEAGEFIRKLKAEIARVQDPQLYLLIWLQLLIPTRTEELMTAKWEDFYLSDTNSPTKHSLWTVATPKDGKNKGEFNIEHISSSARNALDTVRTDNSKPRYLVPHDDIHLFPALFNLSKIDVDKLITEKIRLIWPDQQTDSVLPKKFSQFFEHIAKSRSNFHPTFITNTVKHKGNIAYWECNYDQSKALAEWWGAQLGRDGQHFDDTSYWGYLKYGYPLMKI